MEKFARIDSFAEKMARFVLTFWVELARARGNGLFCFGYFSCGKFWFDRNINNIFFFVSYAATQYHRIVKHFTGLDDGLNLRTSQ